MLHPLRITSDTDWGSAPLGVRLHARKVSSIVVASVARTFCVNSCTVPYTVMIGDEYGFLLSRLTGLSIANLRTQVIPDLAR